MINNVIQLNDEEKRNVYILNRRYILNSIGSVPLNPIRNCTTNKDCPENINCIGGECKGGYLTRRQKEKIVDTHMEEESKMDLGL